VRRDRLSNSSKHGRRTRVECGHSSEEIPVMAPSSWTSRHLLSHRLDRLGSADVRNPASVTPSRWHPRRRCIEHRSSGCRDALEHRWHPTHPSRPRFGAQRTRHKGRKGDRGGSTDHQAFIVACRFCLFHSNSNPLGALQVQHEDAEQLARGAGRGRLDCLGRRGSSFGTPPAHCWGLG
jgi:hypothetical protein